MKKIVSLFLAVFMAATAAAGLTACDDSPAGSTSADSSTIAESSTRADSSTVADSSKDAAHEHDYAEAWSSDEAYHWHACVSAAGICDAPQKDKAEHGWDDGVITVEATAEADGVKTYTCTICGKTKTEPVEYVAPATVITETTDFSALVSERVDEKAWKAAFDIENVTIKIHDNKYGDEEDSSVKLNGGEIYVNVGGYGCFYYNKLEDGTIVGSDGTTVQTCAPDNEEYQQALTGYNYMLNWNYPDFSGFYSSFTYDDSKGAYILKASVKTNSVFEGWDMTYEFAELKIINGKLAYVRWGNYSDNEILNDKSEYFYDFGTTVIASPSTD